MYECFPYDPDFNTCFVDKTRIEIAINMIEKIFKKQNPELYTDWAGLSPKWEKVKSEGTVKRIACPEELKEAYQSMRDVREALLKLERSLCDNL